VGSKSFNSSLHRTMNSQRKRPPTEAAYLERIWEGSVRTILGLALSCAIVGPTAAAESDQKATIVGPPARVCSLTGELVLGMTRRCFYADCILGIDVKSDEACPLNLNPATFRSKTGH
jgi:hypothetical protein